MKARNRLFAILLALAMVITYTPGLAYALEEQPDANTAVEEPLDGGEAVETPQDNDQTVPTAEQAVGEEAPAGDAVEAEGEDQPPLEEEKSGEEDKDTPTLTSMELKPISVTPDVELADSDELLWGFLNKELKGGETPSKKSVLKSRKAPRGDQLEGCESNVYEYLKTQIEAFTDPEEEATLENAVFDIDLSVVLGHELDRVTVNDDETFKVTSDEMEAIQNFDLNAVVSSLLADMPYELFWFDKSVSGASSLSTKFGSYYPGDEGEYLFVASPSLKISFKVSVDYSADGSRGTTAFNLSKINDVKATITNAGAIINSADALNDYEKLIAYKDAICERTSYNDDAAANQPPYGDPWQMIYVFDGDASTKVVCEGYSKAFQYLCDNTTFDRAAIECYSVSGTMGGGTGAGPHMWNILHMDDGHNYIADITNSDEGSVGYTADNDPDGSYLFLNGYNGTTENGYDYLCNGQLISYVYDDDTLSLYSSEELEMSSFPYMFDDDEDDPISVELTLFQDEVLINDKVGFSVDHEGSVDEYRIYKNYSENAEPDVVTYWEPSSDDIMIVYDEPGTYNFRVEAVSIGYDDETDEDVVIDSAFDEATITVLPGYGDTGNFSITGVNGVAGNVASGITVTRGETITIECEAAECGENKAAHYWIDADAYDPDNPENGWHGDFVHMGVDDPELDTITLSLNTISLEPGQYMLSVGANAPGYTTSLSDNSFVLTVEDLTIPAGETMYLDVPEASLETGEEFSISAYCPGAEEVHVYMDYDGMVEEWSHDSDGDFLLASAHYNNSGTYRLVASAGKWVPNEDGDCDDYVELGHAERTMTVTAAGGWFDLNMPELPSYIDLSDETENDLTLTFTKPANAEWMWIEVRTDYDPLIEDETEEDTFTATISKDALEPESTLIVRMGAGARGYEYTEEERRTPVIAGISDAVTLSTDIGENATVPVNQAVNVTVTSDGSKIEELRLYDGEEFRWTDLVNNTSFSDELRFDRPGTYTILANVRLEGSEDFITSNPVTFEVTSSGKTGAFSITDASGDKGNITEGITVTRGNDVTVTCGNSTNAGWYWLNLEKYDPEHEHGEFIWYDLDMHPDSDTNEISFNTIELAPGTYRIGAMSGGIGYVNTASDNSFELEVEPLDLGEGEMYFEVSKNELETGEDYTFSAYCPDAEYIRVYMDYSNGPGWNRDNTYSENRDVYVDNNSYGNAGTYVLRAEAYRYDEDEEDDVVIAYAEQEMTVTAPNGDLSIAIPDGIPSYIVEGSGTGIDFTMAMPENGDHMRAEVFYEYEDGWDDDSVLFSEETDEDTLHVHVDADALREGMTLVVNMEAWGRGYNQDRKELRIPVLGETSEQITLSASKTNTLVNEDIKFTIDTGNLDVAYVEIFNGWNLQDVDEKDGEGKYIKWFSLDEGGTHAIYAKAWINDPDNPDADPVCLTSAPVVITVTSNGPVGPFSITSAGGSTDLSNVTVARGNSLEIVYGEATNADHYCIDAEIKNDEDEWEGYGNYADTNQLTARLSTATFEPGEYRLRAQAWGLGYERRESSNYVFMTVTENTVSDIIFDVSDYEVVTHENIEYSAYFPGADRITVYMDYVGDARWTDNNEYADDRESMTGRCSYPRSGIYSLVAVAEAWDDSTGEYNAISTSDPISITVTAPNGSLEIVVPEAVPASITEGTESVVFIVQKPEGADGLSVRAWIEGEDGNIYEVDTDEDSLSVTISTGSIPEGSVLCVQIGAWGLGYEDAEETVRIPVTGAQSENMTLAMVNTGDVVCGNDIAFTLTPAEGISITGVQFFDGYGFRRAEEPDGDGIFRTTTRFNEAGTFTVYAKATIEGVEVTSNVVAVTVTSNGPLQITAPELPTQLCIGESLSIEFERPQNAHSYGVEAYYIDENDEYHLLYGGYEEGDDTPSDIWTETDESVTLPIPADALWKGLRFTVRFKGWGIGYDFNNVERSITVMPHSMTHHEEVSATCEAAGNDEYWSCSRCGKYFSDEDGTNIIEEGSWVIAAGHDLTAYPAIAKTCTADGNSAYWSCSRCGKYFSDEACEHEIEEDSWVIAAGHEWGDWTVTTPPTEESAGEETRECGVCHETETRVVPALTHEHTLVPTAATEPTCTTDGNSAYWTCSVCGRYFSDEDGTTGIEEGSWVIPGGHSMTHHEAVAASCEEAGTLEYWSCSKCEKNFSDEAGTTELTSIVDPKKGHAMTHHEAVSATCTEDGTLEYWACSLCEKNYSDAAGTTELTNIVDPKKGHSMTHHEAVSATCTAAGTLEHWACSRCEKNYSDAAGTTVLTNIVDPKKAHTMTHHEAVSATCEAAGTLEYWACSECNKNYSDEAGTTELTSIVDPKKAHSMTHHEAVSATCTAAGTLEYWHCTLCNKNYSDEAGTTELTNIVDPAGHKMTHHEANPATCTEVGHEEYYDCSRCDKLFSDATGEHEIDAIPEIAAIGHKWGEPSYVWSEDKSTCTATAICENDPTHKAEKTVETTSEITKEPTTEEEGEITYTAVFEDEPFTTQTATEMIPVLSEEEVLRVYGATRYETSLRIADYYRDKINGGEKFGSVVITTGENFPDALAGSYFANQNGAPILMINAGSAASVVSYVKDNMAANGTVYVLGSDKAVAGSWLGDLETKRLQGADRYLTNIAILEEAGISGGEILVCTGTNYADALSGSGLDMPILLVGTELTAAQKEYLSSGSNWEFHIVGSAVAVNAKVETQLKEYGKSDRTAGNDRYDTSEKLANTYAKNPKRIVLATGQAFPDGLCGGPVAYKLGAPIILADPGAYGSNHANNYAHSKNIRNGLVLGSTVRINDKTARDIFQMGSDNSIVNY